MIQLELILATKFSKIRNGRVRKITMNTGCMQKGIVRIWQSLPSIIYRLFSIRKRERGIFIIENQRGQTIQVVGTLTRGVGGSAGSRAMTSETPDCGMRIPFSH